MGVEGGVEAEAGALCCGQRAVIWWDEVAGDSAFMFKRHVSVPIDWVVEVELILCCTVNDEIEVVAATLIEIVVDVFKWDVVDVSFMGECVRVSMKVVREKTSVVVECEAFVGWGWPYLAAEPVDWVDGR